MLLNWKSLFRREQFEAGVAEEFAFHLEARRQDLMRQGLSEEEAARKAQLEFGAAPRYSEECRESHRIHWFDDISRDLRYGVRTLVKNPIFSTAAILSLALGLGVNTLVFSVFDSLLLRPLPIAHPEQVTFIETTGGPTHSYPNYRQFRDTNQSFTGLAGYRISPMSLDAQSKPSRGWGYLATGNYFDLLGVKPYLGRFFHQEDDLHVGASPWAVLSYSAWVSRFARDSQIAGKTVHINGLPYSILGVAPPGFHGTELFYWPDVWVPMSMEPQIEPGNAWLDNPHSWNTWILGRLKPGMTTARATTDLNRIANDLARRLPDANEGLHIRLSSLGLIGTAMRGPVQAFTGGLLLLAGLVLLTACANLAGLTLARAADRQREMAIRFSIGAGRMRIIRQLLTESLLLSFCGGAAGLSLAVVLTKLLSQWHAPIDFPVQFAVDPDWRVFLFAAGASALTGILFGIGPAWQLSRTDVNSVLKGGSGMVLLKRRFRFAFRDLLVSVEVALCFVLVFGSFLALSGLRNALHMPIGIEPAGVATAAVDLGLAGYDQARGDSFQRQALLSLQRLPGITSAAYANSLPLSIDQSTTGVQPADQPTARGRDVVGAGSYSVSPGFLSTLGIPLLRGRDFDERDSAQAPPVAIVNQTFARTVMKTNDPVGKSFRMAYAGGLTQVIGLAQDGKYVTLTETPRPVLFRPSYQNYNGTTTFFVKSRLPVNQAVDQIRAKVAVLDSSLPLYGAGSVISMLGFALFPMQAAAVALGAFGFLALVLAVTGIHGLVAYAVARRTREIGIRIAIGARPAEVLRLVLGKLAWLILTGLVTGVALALAAGRALSAIIYGTSPGDPLLMALVLALLAIAAALSCWSPARRALRTDPMTAVRYE